MSCRLVSCLLLALLGWLLPGCGLIAAPFRIAGSVASHTYQAGKSVAKKTAKSMQGDPTKTDSKSNPKATAQAGTIDGPELPDGTPEGLPGELPPGSPAELPGELPPGLPAELPGELPPGLPAELPGELPPPGLDDTLPPLPEDLPPL